jgi:fatty-acyl-CoA synthase
VTTLGPLAHWPAEIRELDERPVGTVLLDTAERIGDHPALIWPTETRLVEISYRQLATDATALAGRLRRAIGGEGTVGICAPACPEWIIAEYGAALAGMALVPIDPALTNIEIEHIVRTSSVAALLAGNEFRGASLRARLDRLESDVGLCRVYALECWRDLPTGVSAQLPVVDPTQPFLIQFTSGTTGKPKGAVLSHRAAYNCSRFGMERMAGTSSDVWLSFVPMHHVGGSVSVLLYILAVGGTVVLLPAFDPARVLELVERTAATTLCAVPTMLLALMEHPLFVSTDVSTIRLIQTGGTSVPAALIEQVEREFGCVVVNGYGQSEAPNSIFTSPTDDAETKGWTIGTPLPCREVRIADADGQTLGIGEPGELLMRSPLLMDGYVGVAGPTAGSGVDSDGWLHTGDVCSMDARGVFSIRGRLRDVIIRGGENIYPAEVEEVLLGHPAIAEIAVVGVADPQWGEVPVAFFRRSGDVAPSGLVLEQFARERLASFKVPRRWVEVDAFPVTAVGKVKKFELRSMIPSHDG